MDFPPQKEGSRIRNRTQTLIYDFRRIVLWLSDFDKIYEDAITTSWNICRIIWSYRIEHQIQLRNQFSQIETNWFQSMRQLMPTMNCKCILFLFCTLFHISVWIIGFENCLPLVTTVLVKRILVCAIIDVNLIHFRRPLDCVYKAYRSKRKNIWMHALRTFCTFQLK